MGKIVYLLTIVLLWSGYLYSFILLKDWELFKAVVLIFLAVAEAFVFLTGLLIFKAAKAQS